MSSNSGLIAKVASMFTKQTRLYLDPDAGSTKFRIGDCVAWSSFADSLIETNPRLNLNEPPISLGLKTVPEVEVKSIYVSENDVDIKVSSSKGGSADVLSGSVSRSGTLDFTFKSKTAYALLFASAEVQRVDYLDKYANTLHDKLKAPNAPYWPQAPAHQQYGIVMKLWSVSQMVLIVSSEAGATATVEVKGQVKAKVDGVQLDENSTFDSFGSVTTNSAQQTTSPACTPLLHLYQFNQRLLEAPKFVALP